MENIELHSRNWRSFESTFSQDYLRAHRKVEETHNHYKSGEQHDVERSFTFLASTFSDVDSAGVVWDSLENARKNYKLACDMLAEYFDIHNGLIQCMANLGPGSHQEAPRLSALCGEVSRQADLVNSHINEMMTSLLEVIVGEPKTGGTKYVRSASSPDGR